MKPVQIHVTVDMSGSAPEQIAIDCHPSADGLSPPTIRRLDRALKDMAIRINRALAPMYGCDVITIRAVVAAVRQAADESTRAHGVEFEIVASEHGEDGVERVWERKP